tara:strand:+ start:244 stop:744 length:501 start_codon:yes stop_codon:yes gene_type:complete
MNFLSNLKEKKKNILKIENIYFLLIIAIIFFLDRLSKIKIIKDLNENTYFINDYINLDLIWNIGIGFGLFSTNSFLFYNLVTVLIGIVILSLFYISIISNKLDKLIYSIIIGGALGNFSDRLIYKAVPDFIDLHYNNFHWFVFNVADIFITLGIFALLISSIIEKN